MRWLFLLLTLAAPLLAPPGVAAADFSLERSSPTAGAMVESLTDIELAFNEPVRPETVQVMVIDTLGRRVPVGRFVRDPYDRKVLRGSVSGRVQPGPLYIEWRAASKNGRPARGRFSVQMRPPVGKSGSPR